MAGVREHDEQTCCSLQRTARFRSGTSHSFFPDLKMWCTEAIEKARVQRLKHAGRPFYQNEPELILV